MCKKLGAEFIGTLWLVLGGCGAAIFAGATIGWLGVAFAFGLSVLTMVYAVGPISGAHLNPAISVGLAVAGRFNKKDVIPYIVAQCLGAIAAAAILYLIVSGKEGAEIGTFAANGFGDHSPDGYGLSSAVIAEFVLTFIFLMVVLGATSLRAAPGFAGLAIGLCLTAIHLVCIPITNTSVNPARSLSQALFVGDWALAQLWVFLVFPTLGGAVAGLVWRCWDKDVCPFQKSSSDN